MNSYKNWVDPNKFDLTCTQHYIIALPATVYFIGFGISSGIMPRIGDKYGRKRPFVVCFLVQTILQFFIFFS